MNFVYNGKRLIYKNRFEVKQMPESKKRTKKNNKPTQETVYKNPLKKTWGKVVVIILVVAFILGLVATTAIIVWQAVFGM